MRQHITFNNARVHKYHDGRYLNDVKACKECDYVGDGYFAFGNCPYCGGTLKRVVARWVNTPVSIFRKLTRICTDWDSRDGHWEVKDDISEWQ